MGAVTDAISAMKVQQWGRTTMADGQWLQEKTFNQLDARDIRLANEIDSINERIPTSGSSYDGLIPWITDGNLERNPLYVITDGTGTSLQNAASGDKKFYVAPSFFNNDDGKVFGIKEGKAEWVTPFNGVKINGETTTDISKLQFYKKGEGTYQVRLNNPAGEDIGSLPPTPGINSENKVPMVHKVDDRYYYYLDKPTDYRFGDTINHAPLNQDDGKVLTVTSGEGGNAYVDWKTAPGTVEFRTLQSYSSDQNKKLVKTSTFAMPKINAKYYGTIGFSTNIPGSYSIVPLSGDTLLNGIVYESQCINLRNVPSGQICHYNFYFNADDPNKLFTHIGIKGDAVTSGASVDIDYCSVFYQE